MSSWNLRVTTYLDGLSDVVATVDGILAQARVDASAVDRTAVEKSAADLQQSLLELEQQVAWREALIGAPDAPANGLTLTEKLRALGSDEDAALAARCDELAGRIAIVYQRSIAIFVCQFHLAELTTDLVRLLVGDDLPATYQPVPSKDFSVQGGLLNESA